MRILFYRYRNLCEPDMIDAFRTLGHEVREQAAFDESDRRGSLLSAQAVSSLSKVLLDHPCDIVFSVNFFPSVSEVCNIFRIPYLCWVVTSPVMELFSKHVSHPCNHIFVFDDAIRADIEGFAAHVYHLPLAAAAARSAAAIAAYASVDDARYDISFIGSLYTEKNAYRDLRDLPPYTEGYLEAMLEAQRKVYGWYFVEELLPDHIVTDYRAHHKNFYSLPGEHHLTDRTTLAQLYLGAEITVRDRLASLQALSARFDTHLWSYDLPETLSAVHFHGTAESTKQMPSVLHRSNINLNPTARAIRSGLALRLWDILAAGGFCLTNFQPELPLFFEAGVTLDWYTSEEELIEKCAYYLSHEKERAEIARNGLELVRAQHTYEIRMEEMLRMAGL